MTQEQVDGYRREPAGGPRIRSDIIEVYVFRRSEEAAVGVEFLQLHRSSDPLGGTWHPVMGHIEESETAVRCAAREMSEEIGLGAESGSLVGFWALEQVHPFYVHQIDCVVLSPRFAAEVVPAFVPMLNNEHGAYRWTEDPDEFLWPGQRSAAIELVRLLGEPDSPSRAHLAIDLRSVI